MDIEFKNNSIRKICTNASEARKKIGQDNAKMLFQRLAQISAADSIEELVQGHIGKCHLLIGNRSGQYAMHLNGSYRLVFTVHGSPNVSCIIEIVDYH